MVMGAWTGDRVPSDGLTGSRSNKVINALMVDGLSPARHAATGLTSTVLANVAERPWTGFFLFAVAHAAVWTVLPYTLYPNLPLDLIEALTYGREWQIGYDKLPPLPWWLVEAAYRTFGTDFVYYCLGQLSVLAAFAAVWALMLRIANPAAALAAILIIDGLHYFNFTAPKFNHDVIQLPFWALAGLSFHGALRSGRLTHWMTLGAALGLAFWAKYFVVILALPLVLFMLIDRRARRFFATPGPYVAVAIMLVIIAPHLVWLVDSNFLPFDYLESRARSLTGFFDHFTRPAFFAFAQLFWLLPAIIISLPLLQRPREAEAIAADDYDRRILALLTFGPAVTVIAASALSGRGLVSMWGYPLWLFLGPWIVVAVGSRIDRRCLTRIAGVWAVVTVIYVATFIAQYAVLPSYDHRYRAVLFPGEQLATQIATRYQDKTGMPLAYVVGSMWLGGNIGHYAPEHPRTLIDGNPRRAPWIDLKDLAARGGAVVWTSDNSTTVPERYAAVAGNAVVQPPFVLPMRRGNGEIYVGWAIIPAGAKP
jgi:4-amino-4-deoxy-L-arabinose transferase-like glycosyltransferase